jgi:hypothetical protein
MRIWLSLAAVGLVGALGGIYHFGGVTAAAIGALTIPLLVPFFLGRLGNQAVRASMGQPDQLKHRELRRLVDEVNGLLTAVHRAKDELGIALEGQGTVEAAMAPLGKWTEPRQGPVPLYVMKTGRFDNLQLDQISGVHKKIGTIEKDLVTDLDRRLDEEDREIVAGLQALGGSTLIKQGTDTAKEGPSPSRLDAFVSARLQQRSRRVEELEVMVEHLEATCKEVEHEFPSVGKYEKHLASAKQRLAEMDTSAALRLIKEAAEGIGKRPQPRFEADRTMLLNAIMAVEETQVLDHVDPQTSAAFKTYTRAALDEKDPLRYRRFRDRVLEFPQRVQKILHALEQECIKIDQIMQKDYFIEYRERFSSLDKEVRAAEVLEYSKEAVKRLEHLKGILEDHADERRISENYARVEKRIRRLLQEQGSVGPEDLKVRAPERYLHMFAQREAAAVLEAGRLRLATDADLNQTRDPVNDLGQAEMEYEG